MNNRLDCVSRGAVDGVPPPPVVLLTVTVIVADVALFPATSRTRAARVCAPLAAVVVFHVIEYGALVSGAGGRAVDRNCTPATPVLSDAEAEIVVVPETSSCRPVRD
jgi:hypothetical protein